MSHCQVDGTYAGKGGGMAWVEGGHMLMHNVTLRGCRSRAGGALQLEPRAGDTETHPTYGEMITRATVYDCIIEDCSATSGDGGAVRLDLNTELIISGGRITDCSATGSGGAFFLMGATQARTMTRATLDRVTIANADASEGGVIAMESGTAAALSNVLITGARSLSGSGGVAYLQPATEFSLTNAAIAETEASSAGGVLYMLNAVVNLKNISIVGARAGSEGGAFSLMGGTTVLTGGSLTSCTAGTKGGAVFHGSGSLAMSNVDLVNNVASSGAAIYSAHSEGPNLQASGVFIEHTCPPSPPPPPGDCWGAPLEAERATGKFGDNLAYACGATSEDLADEAYGPWIVNLEGSGTGGDDDNTTLTDAAALAAAQMQCAACTLCSGITRTRDSSFPVIPYLHHIYTLHSSDKRQASPNATSWLKMAACHGGEGSKAVLLREPPPTQVAHPEMDLASGNRDAAFSIRGLHVDLHRCSASFAKTVVAADLRMPSCVDGVFNDITVSSMKPFCAATLAACLDLPVTVGATQTAPTCVCTAGSYIDPSGAGAARMSPYDAPEGCVLPVEARDILNIAQNVTVLMHKTAAASETVRLNLTLDIVGDDGANPSAMKWFVEFHPTWISFPAGSSQSGPFDPERRDAAPELVLLPVDVDAAGLAESGSEGHIGRIGVRFQLSTETSLAIDVRAIVTADPASANSQLQLSTGNTPTAAANTPTAFSVAIGEQAVFELVLNDVDGLPLLEPVRGYPFSTTVTRQGEPIALEARILHSSGPVYEVSLTPTLQGLYEVVVHVNEARVPGVVTIEVLCRSDQELLPDGETCGCPAGDFATDEDTCARCGPGTFSALAGALSCDLCNAGTFAAGEGATECDECAEGTFNAEPGQAVCAPCAEGYFSAFAGALSCDICNTGTFAAGEGAAECEPCAEGTFNAQPGRAVCEPCPHMLWSRPGSRECPICAAGFFESTTGCEVCPKWADCPRHLTNLTLRTVPLKFGYWRLSDRTADVRSCTTTKNATVSACLGSVDGTNVTAESTSGGLLGRKLQDEESSTPEADRYCMPGHTGTLCRLCLAEDTYYDTDSSSCKPCTDARGHLFEVGIPVTIFVLVVLFVLAQAYVYYRDRMPRTTRFVVTLKEASANGGLPPKLKIAIGFYQVVSTLSSVYRIPFPEEYTRIMAPFDFLQELSLDIFIPSDCISNFTSNLAIGTFWPYITLLLAAFFSITVNISRALFARDPVEPGKEPVQSSKLLREAAFGGLIGVLPAGIFLTFMCYTSVCAHVFNAFRCEPYELDSTTGEEWSFLVKHPAVRCKPATSIYDGIFSFGLVCMVGWCFAVPLVYFLLLRGSRLSITMHRPNTLSRAISGLWKEYEPQFWWWEPLEVSRKLLLTGVVLLIPEETILLRTIIALLVSLFALVATGAALPFHRGLDDFLYAVSQLVLVIAFFASMLMKICESEEYLCQLMGFEDIFELSMGLLIFNFLVVGLVLVVAAWAMMRTLVVKQIRLVGSKEMPTLTLKKEHKFHTFLSHIWSTGQDQCRGIKGQLLLLLPGLHCFLDVDNLEDISKLEDYIDQTATILMFLSRGYMVSRNCLREIRATVEKSKPFILVIEADKAKGGHTLSEARQECPEELREPIFDHGMTPITWLRIIDFQLLSLKLICHEMLRVSPLYSVGAGAVTLKKGLYIPREVMSKKLACDNVVLYASPNNPGAVAAAAEVAAQIKGVTMVETLEGATHMLLYLSYDTWLGEKGTALAEEVGRLRADKPHQAMALDLFNQITNTPQKLPIIMLHEQDPDSTSFVDGSQNAACEFGRFFSTTPQGLIDGGLYHAIATALYAPPHRAVGIALSAMNHLGAKEQKKELVVAVAKERLRRTSTAGASVFHSMSKMDVKEPDSKSGEKVPAKAAASQQMPV
jgi:uncharacterized membrane protein YbaN (DUF454 family)